MLIPIPCVPRKQLRDRSYEPKKCTEEAVCTTGGVAVYIKQRIPTTTYRCRSPARTITASMFIEPCASRASRQEMRQFDFLNVRMMGQADRSGVDVGRVAKIDLWNLHFPALD
ncbi:hypothetical protein MRX96_014581 [Rhipicephalus microplus]